MRGDVLLGALADRAALALEPLSLAVLDDHAARAHGWPPFTNWSTETNFGAFLVPGVGPC